MTSQDMLGNTLGSLPLLYLVNNWCHHDVLGWLNAQQEAVLPQRSYISIRENQSKQLSIQSSSLPHEEVKDSITSCSEKQVHYETYKQIKSASSKKTPGISKTQIYEKLLKPFKHQKRVVTTPVTHKETTVYICKYEGCDKEYTKIWNLLDHVRMHEGIKPYQCDSCSKSFTQKGNLKKHMKQHQLKTIRERKRFECRICKKKYTEKYNLKAHMKTHDKAERQRGTPAQLS
ncbi:unnamed protein product [Moneuplotes crassus]|uniref:C2H2-type domain-containing protein n=1 Tax=Euplotes crassus TaxID=5936 RepID=A0AAD1U723_EUPCR|nr:unnamed protein product [Moneuplotes crassus]